MSNANAQSAHFTNFFKWRQKRDWNVLRSGAYSRIPLRGLHPVNSIISSQSRPDERISKGSSLNVISPERNFETSFGHRGQE